MPIVTQEVGWNTNIFLVRNIFTDEAECHETSGVPYSNIWVGPQSFIGIAFHLDLSRSYYVEKILIRNSHNRNFRDRATGKFSIEVSEHEDGPWAKATSGTLQDVRKMEYKDIPLEQFEVYEHFRFLRFIENRILLCMVRDLV